MTIISSPSKSFNIPFFKFYINGLFSSSPPLALHVSPIAKNSHFWVVKKIPFTPIVSLALFIPAFYPPFVNIGLCCPASAHRCWLSVGEICSLSSSIHSLCPFASPLRHPFIIQPIAPTAEYVLVRCAYLSPPLSPIKKQRIHFGPK